MKKITSRTKKLIREALREDIGPRDLTSALLVGSAPRGTAIILAKEGGIFFGEALTRELLHCVDSGMKVRFYVRDGAPFQSGKKLLEISGKIISILKAERTLMNFLGQLCGIATQTRELVNRVRKFNVKILDTRKTTPLWRELEKAAVLAGGGKNHRMGLYDEIFVKENHRSFGKLKRLKSFPRAFVIEVRNLAELKEALTLKPRVVLFDNFSPARLKCAVNFARKLDSQVLLEASGGIHAGNLLRYAGAGIDQISMGSLTHSVKAIDLSLLIQPSRHE